MIWYSPFRGNASLGAFICIFAVALERLGVCPAGLEPPAGARNSRKATVKIRRSAT